jgi:RimJ/RimL family protein N-acetyltransferase
LKDEGIIQGRRVALRPATPEDEPQILEWLFHSDITHSLLGPPPFPERPVPEPADSSQTLDPHYLDGTAPELGRCFLILVDDEPVGQVTYNDIVKRDECRQVELDIWMRSESCCGKSYGTDALDALCGYLHKTFGVEQFMVQPSARNPRAIRAYEKIGFQKLELPIEAARQLWGPNDYCDSVYMVRTIYRLTETTPTPTVQTT